MKVIGHHEDVLVDTKTMMLHQVLGLNVLIPSPHFVSLGVRQTVDNDVPATSQFPQMVLIGHNGSDPVKQVLS